MRLLYNFQIKVITLLGFLFIAGCKKNIIPPSPQYLTFSEASVTLSIDEFNDHKLIVTSNGNILDQGNLNWKSDNEHIAKVDKSGVVTAVDTGKTVITATLTNGQGAAQCKIIVIKNQVFKIRLLLKDKGISNYSLNKPNQFLSDKAISRRIKEKIALDYTDLPISSDYLGKISSLGGKIVAQSKWLNTVCVYVTDQSLIDDYKSLPFVQSVTTVWHQQKAPIITRNDNSVNFTQTEIIQIPKSYDANYYGTGWDNIRLENGQSLHSQGFTGVGIDIAIIDAGFPSFQGFSIFKNINVKGAKCFLYESNNPFALDMHGIWVASCLAANQPGSVVGTAPDANYWFLVSEDVSSESPIEEDYYVSALEYADSVGVDVVNTSLLYKNFDDPNFTPKFESYNGSTLTSTLGVNMAFKKGMFITGAAGNDHSWVATPSDSPYILTVGAIDVNYLFADFTSYGYTADGRIKPDVVSLGANVPLIFGNFNGTSFASPIICGLVACLWQAYPKLDNKDLLDIMRKSSNRYESPLLPYGYGLPNMEKAMELGAIVSSTK